MQRSYNNPPPAHSPPLHHPIPQHVSTVPQLRSPPPLQPPSQPHSAYGYGQQGGGMPQQQGGFGVHPSFGNFVQDPTAQLGFQMGKSAVDAGQQYVEQNLGRYVSVGALKHYFNVSNSYVVTKLRIILFPWWHRPWSRKQHADASGAAPASSVYLPPREDINSPDMYIPTMALVTYILLSTLLAGLRGAFNPEILGYTATRAIAITFVDILLIKLGTYSLGITSSSQLLDLVAYSGYKFVHVTVSLVLSHAAALIGFSGSWTSWVIFLYCFSSNAFFLMRSLRYVLRTKTNTHDVGIGGGPYAAVVSETPKSNDYFLFGYSFLFQLIFMLWLSAI